ncbi:MAG: hypothetical protein LBT51_06110 [Fusobacteriaceae bacterium]|jgi:uncharacterized protein (UPF0128 family)|nr:hypothetical protein [Fusobacteriaceae bacterium]
MGVAYIENDNFHYETFLLKRKMPISEILWAYLQIEDVKLSVCCGRSTMVVSRLILRTRAKKITLELDSKERVNEILKEFKDADIGIVIGYKKELENVFDKDYNEFLKIAGL